MKGRTYYLVIRKRASGNARSDMEEHEMEATIHEITPRADHAHHWLIEEASGPLSQGRCKRCGAVREFKNWLEDTDFITNEEHRIAA